MNKHMVFLPAILTLAVALHGLSYYIEEPEEVVSDPNIKVGSNNVVQPNNTENKHPDNSVTIPAEKGNETVTINEVKVTQEVKGEKKETVVPVAKVVETSAANNTTQTATDANTQPGDQTVNTGAAETTNPGTTIQIATGLIPSKNFNEIVKEAKVSGGRVDPFLSMKPPELEKLPEMPVNANGTQEAVPDNSNSNKVASKAITNPPTAWVPDFKENKQKTNKNTKVKPGSEPDMIVFEQEPKVDEGLILTGIITGSKPLAVVTVDKESKVFTIGDVIRKKNNIRIVSIDFDTQAITVVDEKRRRAKIEIRE